MKHVLWFVVLILTFHFTTIPNTLSMLQPIPFARLYKTDVECTTTCSLHWDWKCDFLLQVHLYTSSLRANTVMPQNNRCFHFWTKEANICTFYLILVKSFVSVLNSAQVKFKTKKKQWGPCWAERGVLYWWLLGEKKKMYVPYFNVSSIIVLCMIFYL